jgi:chromosome segregation ATPase
MNSQSISRGQEAIKSLVDKVTEKQQALSHLETKLASRQHTLRSLESEISILQAHKSELLKHIKGLHENNDNLQRDLEKIHQKLDLKKSERGQMSVTIENLRKNLTDIQSSESVQRSQHDKKLSEKEYALNFLRSQIV